MYMDPRAANCHIHIPWEWTFYIPCLYNDQQLSSQQLPLGHMLLILMPLSILPLNPNNEGRNPSKCQGSSYKMFEVAYKQGNYFTLILPKSLLIVPPLSKKVIKYMITTF